MESLKQAEVNEYTDTKNNKHKVSHFLISDEGNNDKERIIEELFNALTRSGKRSVVQA